MKLGFSRKTELEALTTVIQEIAEGCLSVSFDGLKDPELQPLVAAVRQMTANFTDELKKAHSLGAALRNVVESVPIGLLKWSNQGEILFANRSVILLWGCEDLTELKSGGHIQALFSQPAQLKRLMQDAAENGPVSDFELTIRRRNGEQRLLSSTVAVVRDEEDEITGFVGAFRDVSGQREMEVHLIQIEKLETISSFATGLAHDLNNILCGILPNAEMLRLSLTQNPSGSSEKEKGLHLLDSIDRSAQCGVTLARQLMSFSRKTPAHLTVVNLNQVIGDSLDSLRQSLGSGIRMETDLAQGLWNIEADHNQLEEILFHLGRNAQQAMKGVGVFRVMTQNISHEASSINRYRGLKPGEYVQLAVSDLGRGIAPHNLHRIFDPFFDGGGMNQEMGLALSLVFGMVKEHHGHIDVESQLNVGTTFKIHFPRTLKEPMLEATPEATPAHRPERILVVDDEALVREATVELLSELGYEVVAVPDGDEALNRITQKEEYDLVLLDIQMPRLNGHETLTRLREVKPHLKVLLTSGHSPSENVEDLLQRYQCGFLQKPYRLADISRMVRSALDGTVLAAEGTA
ncbi:MAG: response regulator [Acidobacteriia bacterium]|nr:response regulator [Terriglobia bacterium]